EALGEVGEVDEIAEVLSGEDLADEVDEVVAGAGRELGGVTGRQLEVRDVVDADLDPVLVPPLLRELVEPYVVGGNEMAPDQDSEVRALDLGRRLPRQQHVPERRAGDDRAGGLEEAATVEGGGGGLGRALLTHRGTSSRRDENGSRGTACTPWPWIEW